MIMRIRNSKIGVSGFLYGNIPIEVISDLKKAYGTRSIIFRDNSLDEAVTSSMKPIEVGEREADLSAGRNLTLCREQNNLSQDELAEIIGVDRIRISEYENGTRHIPKSTATKFVLAFDVPISYFIETP
jgi:DNA-binding XRE family transcriptional regulator